MRNKFLLIILCALIGCKQIPSPQLPTTSYRLEDEIIKWNDKIIVSKGLGELFEIKNDSLIRFKVDSIVNIKQCKDGFYILKAPNDSALVLENNGNVLEIKNRTGIQSKFFTVLLNENCEYLLEGSGLIFPLQEQSFIDLNKAYGFKASIPRSGTDKIGYFENFVFLAKMPGYRVGGFFTVYLNETGKKYSIPESGQLKSFMHLDNKLWAVTGVYEKIDGQEIVEKAILTLDNGKIEKAIKFDLPQDMDIAAIASNKSNVFVLSEKFGFYELESSELKSLVAVNLKEGNIIPGSFLVDGNLIYLTTFEHGVLKFTIDDDKFNFKQIK